MPKTVLFHRDFRRFTGGHLKVWHYFEHVRSSPRHRARIVFSDETSWDATNPWSTLRGQALPSWRTDDADVLFLAGLDWEVLDPAERRSPPKPVINLIQHVRHADPAQPLYRYLEHPAVRICVSVSVSEALRRTGRVNGPLITIPNGLESAELPPPVPQDHRTVDLLVVGIKQPTLAVEIADRLGRTRPEMRVQVLTEPVARSLFLEMLARARLAVLLPHRTEGFYLPALEGFALETLTICPDCVGNRGFCVPDETCLMPNYTVDALLGAVQKAMTLSSADRHRILSRARTVANTHSLGEERRAFLEVLEQVTQ
ncbi:glycosyltransferase family 1 protein [Thiocapsa rosea]|uniref:Glycosyl transferase family 1 n=1 Tax=Thiocapsa rosea TaxID=69360 RepID=A0A495V7V7_9GAMM|nr:glycosyltransferase family 1 protein [Thiocapsa rosea]RKT44447.1 hypothetical protein BDD21_1829 [Thiocapsa rosea]